MFKNHQDKLIMSGGDRDSDISGEDVMFLPFTAFFPFHNPRRFLSRQLVLFVQMFQSCWWKFPQVDFFLYLLFQCVGRLHDHRRMAGTGKVISARISFFEERKWSLGCISAVSGSQDYILQLCHQSSLSLGNDFCINVKVHMITRHSPSSCL